MSHDNLSAARGVPASPSGSRPFGTEPQASRPSASIPNAGWISVAERMPDSGVTVLACYTNEAGKARRIRASWVAAKSCEASIDYSECAEYDEETDTYYDPEGWYEQIDNWGDYSAVAVCEGDVTHWMPLPELPARGIGADARRARADSPVGEADAPKASEGQEGAAS